MSLAFAGVGLEVAGLSPREKALCDFFVEEYLKDYDPVCAAMRCGFMKEFAKTYGPELLSKSYVQQRLQAREEELASSKKDTAKIKAQIVAGLLREAHGASISSSASSRVAALSRLATIYELDKGAEEQKANRSGVMVVPDFATLEEWEAAAKQSQEKLVNDSAAG